MRTRHDTLVPYPRGPGLLHCRDRMWRRVNQANCSGFGHSDFWQYGYDFVMDIGTVALYSHLTLNGVLVTAGQFVSAGDTIGLSGDTGNTGGLPHLHFSLHPCSDLPGLPGAGSCPSIFVNFRNTAENDSGLEAGRSYEALPFD